AGDYSGVLKSKFSANDGLESDLTEFEDPYSFLFSPTNSGAIKFIGTTESIYNSTISASTFNSLQIGSSDWVVDEHVGKLVRVFNESVTQQFGLIKSNTEDTLEVDFFFEVPVVGENFEILNKTTNLDLSVTDCGGLIFADRCNLNELKIESSATVGTQYCSGSIVANNSVVNSITHFMNSQNHIMLHKSKCEIGFGSFLIGVPLQIAEHFSLLSLSETKLRQCGVTGTHIGTQDFEEGVSIFCRHNSQIVLYSVDADDCEASFMVLIGSQAWIGFSSIGQTVPLPNHVLEEYLNSTYNDGGGNVFNSILDNIKLETGSVSVTSTGSSVGGTGVKIFPDDATLLASTEDDGTIGYTELEGKYFLRTFATWFEHFAPPTPPGTLVGEDLVLVGTSLYPTKIPSGLSSAWSLLTPGNIISNLILDPTYTLDSPDSADKFLAGTVAGGQASAGSLNLIENGSIAESYDIAANGVGTIGRIAITDLVAHDAVYQRANAKFNISLSTEGRNRHAMQHSQSGLSNEVEVYYDDENPTPVFTTPLSIVVFNKISKWLSGIEALGHDSVIRINFTVGTGIFRKTYSTTVGRFDCPGTNGLWMGLESVPHVDDEWIKTNQNITLSKPEVSALPTGTVLIFKPGIYYPSSLISSNAPLPMPVNTYDDIVSTSKADDFFDEDKRIVLNSGTTSGTATPFTSTDVLVDGNAQQRHSGTLQFPDSTDYPTFSGDQEYQRFIAKVGTSIGALTFTGINYTDIDPYGTGDINVLIELAVEGKFFDLGRSIGDNNGTGAGDSRANSKGANNDATSSGSVLAWSLGTDSTAFNNDEYRLIIIFRNSTHTITRISEA
ncbi:hypothetical protein KAR91_86550, partial [Candidatus Pacearchaeota archaeon]|nr:hypothetical protein [Candidatus Pacearchaeota archaeon]